MSDALAPLSRLSRADVEELMARFSAEDARFAALALERGVDPRKSHRVGLAGEGEVLATTTVGNEQDLDALFKGIRSRRFSVLYELTEPTLVTVRARPAPEALPTVETPAPPPPPTRRPARASRGSDNSIAQATALVESVTQFARASKELNGTLNGGG